jgi:hypothetical protein
MDGTRQQKHTQKKKYKKKKWADGLSREFSKDKEQMANKYMNNVLKFPGHKLCISKLH